MDLIVTIDTEADNQWKHGIELSTQNVKFIPEFQSRCERYGILPTYLLTSEIAADQFAASYFRTLVAAGKAEIGSHLHPWTTPPFLDAPGLRYNDEVHAFASQLPRPLLEAKLVNLTRQVAEAVCKRPTSFRAGRFGFSMEYAGVLAQLGYLVDSSVTPMASWSRYPGLNGRGGPNFRTYPVQPYVMKLCGAALMEIPVTVLVTSRLLQRRPRLLFWYKVLARLSELVVGSRRVTWQPLWLQPSPEMDIKKLRLVWVEATRRGLQYAVLMFHSSELMPGGSPYRPTPESVRELLDLLSSFFAEIRGAGAGTLTLSEAAAELVSSASVVTREDA